MSKHIPLPSDPIDRATEKKRRFKVYQKAWKKRRHAEAYRIATNDIKTRHALLTDARRASLDLCLSLDDMSEGQLRKALRVAQDWRSEL